MDFIDETLKPCPFCGHTAILKNNGLSSITNRTSSMIGDYFTRWHVACSYCGIKKSEYTTYYIFGQDGQLRVVDGPDGRSKAIDSWNERK